VDEHWLDARCHPVTGLRPEHRHYFDTPASVTGNRGNCHERHRPEWNHRFSRARLPRRPADRAIAHLEKKAPPKRFSTGGSLPCWPPWTAQHGRAVVCSIATKPTSSRPFSTGPVRSPQRGLSRFPRSPQGTRSGGQGAVGGAGGAAGTQVAPLLTKILNSTTPPSSISSVLETDGLAVSATLGLTSRFHATARPIGAHRPPARQIPNLRFVATHIGAWEDWTKSSAISSASRSTWRSPCP